MNWGLHYHLLFQGEKVILVYFNFSPFLQSILNLIPTLQSVSKATKLSIIYNFFILLLSANTSRAMDNNAENCVMQMHVPQELVTLHLFPLLWEEGTLASPISYISPVH